MAAFEFGPFLLDPAKRSLLRDGVPQSLPPKAFDVLALLVQCRERVVSKEELLSTLWADTFVEEANLSQQIFVLRRTLNGLSESPEYIATIPRRGYRFTAQVIERSESERLAESAPNEPSRRRSRWLVPSLGAAVVLVAALLAVFWRHFAADPDPRILVVTALPGLERFPSISPDGNFVVFSWTGSNADGSSDLWVKAVEGDALRRLTETPAGGVPVCMVARRPRDCVCPSGSGRLHRVGAGRTGTADQWFRLNGGMDARQQVLARERSDR